MSITIFPRTADLQAQEAWRRKTDTYALHCPMRGDLFLLTARSGKAVRNSSHLRKQRHSSDFEKPWTRWWLVEK